MKAVWSMDYDYHTDKTYQRPSCPKCSAPIVRDTKGTFRCMSCWKPIQIEDEAMREWIRQREDIKTEISDCPFCGGKQCVQKVYFRNDVTLEWMLSSSRCRECDSRILV